MNFITAMSIVVHAWRGHTTAAQRERLLRNLAWLFLFGVALYMVFTSAAWAATSPPVGGQTADFSLFDSLDQDAETRSSTWFETILQLVRPTFLILATIEICWAAAIWAFERDSLNSLAIEIIKKIMFFGFFFALLQFAPEWIPTITATFQQVGETASGTGPITTDTIIATGLALIKMVWSHAPTGFFGVLGKLGEILVACFVTLGIIIAYVVLAAQYFTLKVESYILFAAGAIFLGLGSSNWTKDYVSKYLNYAINVGVRLLVLILVLSLLLSTVTEMGNSFSFNFEPLLKLLAVAILQAILGIKAPEMAGALLNGGIGLSAGSAAGAASSGIGGLKTTLGTTLGMAAATVAKVASTGQGVANIGRAAGAGRNIAKQQGKSGAAATLSGLGTATAQAAKLVPGKLMDAIKGKGGAHRGAGGGGGHGRGASPGLFDLTRQNLQARAAGGTPASGSGSGSSSSASRNSSSTESTSEAASASSTASNRSSFASTMTDSSTQSSWLDSSASNSPAPPSRSDTGDSAASLVASSASDTASIASQESGSTWPDSASLRSETTRAAAATSPAPQTPVPNRPNKLRKATAPNRSRPLQSQPPKPLNDI